MDRRLLHLGTGRRGLLAAVVVLGITGGAATVAQAFLLARIVDAVFSRGAERAAVSGLLVGLVAAIGLRAVLVWGERWTARRFADDAVARLREAVIGHIARLGPVGLGAERTGELRTVLVDGLEDVHAWFEDYLPQVVLSALVPFMVAVVVLRLDLLSAAVLITTAPLIPVFMVLIGQLAHARSRRQLRALGRLGAAFLDLIQGLPTLAMMGRARAQVDRAGEVTDELRRTTMATLRLAFVSALALELLSTLSTAVVAVEVGLRLLYGRMEFVHAFTVLLLAPEFYLPLRMLGQRFHAGQAGVAAADRLHELLDREPPVRIVPTSTAAEMPPHPELVLESVTARYPAFGGDPGAPALSGFDLTLGRGEVVALVGASGAGKSTVLNLLLRFMDPAAGRLLGDGVDATTVPVEDWRARFSWVPQRPWLTTGTVAEVVRLGAPGAGDEDLRRAAALARAEGFIHELPLGWATPLGERGARLSGGQVQRLALARAFVRDAPIVLLDEPGAGLDPRTLGELDGAIGELLRARSAVVIAHRMASVERADRVVVMADGRIVDQGTPDEMLNASAAFRALAGMEGAS